MEKKKILFYYSQFTVGGAEKSLIRLMNALYEEGHEVTLLTRLGGGCLNLLHPGICIRSLASDVQLKKHNTLVRFFLLLCLGIQRLINLSFLWFSRKHYDLAIVGLQGLSPAVICHAIHADKRAVCIRNDISSMKARQRVKHQLAKWSSQIDYYFCVSLYVKQALDKELPSLSSKSIVLYNILNAKEMLQNAALAENPYPNDGKKHIVTVCRISDVAKGIFRMLRVAQQLNRENISFTWYLVGEGPDLPAAKQEIQKLGLQEVFIPVGKKDNPFGYYKYSDLVAVPSYYEGLSGVVNEAKITGCAVLATEFSGIHEQLTHGKNGWIVDNNEQAIVNGMRTLLLDNNLLQSIRNNIYPKAIAEDHDKLTTLYSCLGWQ